MNALQNTYIGRSGETNTAPAASALLTHKVLTTRNVHALYLRFHASGTDLTEAQIKTDIGQIIVRLNGVEIVNITATRLADLLSYYRDKVSAAFISGCLRVPFSRQNLPLAGLNRAFALGMIDKDGKPNNLTVEITCNAGLVTADTCEVFYEFDLFPPEEVGAHVRILTHNDTFSSTGYLDITNLPVKGRNAILAYHIVDATGTITDVTVKLDEFDVFAQTPVCVLRDRQHNAGCIRQTGYWHLNFAAQNDLANGLPVGEAASGIMVRPNWPATGPGGAFAIIEECVVNGL
jgi:hypothetical protein